MIQFLKINTPGKNNGSPAATRGSKSKVKNYENKFAFMSNFQDTFGDIETTKEA